MNAATPKPLYMPRSAPLPTPTWDPSLNRCMLYAPKFEDMDPRLQCIVWDYFEAGREFQDYATRNDACPAHEGIFHAGMEHQRMLTQRETDAILAEEFNAIRKSDMTPYWVLAERRGEPKRAAEALARAVERGYAA